MDDHSPNPAKPLLSSSEDKVEVFRNEENLGFSGNLNKALSLARDNEVFLLIIQDDVTLLNRDYIRKCIENFNGTNVAVVCGQPALNLQKKDRRASFARYWDLDFEQEGVTEISYSLLKADVFRISAIKGIGGFQYTQNKSLGLEDQVTSNQLRKNHYRILKDGSLKYGVEDIRSDSFVNFLRKEANYGTTMGFAIAFGKISANVNDKASRSKRNHRVRQVSVVSICAFLAICGIITNALGIPYQWIGDLVFIVLLVEVTVYLLHGRNLSLPLKLYLGIIGLPADFVFMFSFTYGYLQGLTFSKRT
jgi:hypothetical protein